MLVDLGRNNIGRIAQNGSVEVTKYMEVEFFRYSDAPDECGQGSILPGLASIEALKATLPAGTVSGAPKIPSHEADL